MKVQRYLRISQLLGNNESGNEGGTLKFSLVQADLNACVI